MAAIAKTTNAFPACFILFNSLKVGRVDAAARSRRIDPILSTGAGQMYTVAKPL